jgi:hypothetical protein
LGFICSKIKPRKKLEIKMAKIMVRVLDQCSYLCINFDTDEYKCTKTGRSLLAADVLGPSGFPSDCQLPDEIISPHCFAPNNGFYCTLPAGHAGPHEAHRPDNRVAESWPQDRRGADRRINRVSGPAFERLK